MTKFIVVSLNSHAQYKTPKQLVWCRLIFQMSEFGNNLFSLAH